MSSPKSDVDLDEDLLDLSINDPQTTAFTEATLIGAIISDKTINFKVMKLSCLEYGILVQKSKLPS